MNLPRLITIFLVLAVLIGTGAYLWSGNGQGGAGSGVVVSDNSGGVSSTDFSNKGAFVEQLPSASEVAVAKDNMTDILAQSMAQKLVELNPDGPNANGADGVWGPTADMVVNDFIQKPEIYPPLILDEADILAQKTKINQVRVVEKPSGEEMQAYLASFDQVAQAGLSDPQIQNIVSQPGTPEAMGTVGVVLGQSLKQLDELQVPKNMVGMHMAMRDILVGLENMTNMPIQSTDDPVRSALALEKQYNFVREGAERLQKEVDKVGSDKLGEGFNENEVAQTPWWDINRAQAFCIPFVVCFTWDKLRASLLGLQVGQTIADWAKQVATEELKDVLVHRLVQQVITWIQGGGTPKFITNWKSFLDGVSNDAISVALSNLSPRFCKSFGPLITIAMTPVNTAPGASVACTLDQVMSNVQNFYSSFGNGGWISYGATLQPQNNYFGASMQVSDMAMVKSAQATAQKQKELQQAKGYLGDSICQQWDWVASSSTAPGTLPSRQLKCLSYKTTTPGATVSTIVSGNISLGPLQRIVNAQDVAALVSALMNSALHRLITATTDSNGDTGLLAGNSTTPPSAGFSTTCDGLAGQTYQTCSTGAKKTCMQLPVSMQKDCVSAIAPALPSATCGTLGNDTDPPPAAEITKLENGDFSNVNWVDTDVSSWAQTANLSSVTTDQNNICLTYDKNNPDTGGWPILDPNGDDTNANPWVFVWRGGKWQAATFSWMRPGGRDWGDGYCKPALEVANGGAAGSPLFGDFNTIGGETYGFMVSGLARFGTTPNVQERSNVVVTTWTGSSCVVNPVTGQIINPTTGQATDSTNN